MILWWLNLIFLPKSAFTQIYYQFVRSLLSQLGLSAFTCGWFLIICYIRSMWNKIPAMRSQHFKKFLVYRATLLALTYLNCRWFLKVSSLVFHNYTGSGCRLSAVKVILAIVLPIIFFKWARVPLFPFSFIQNGRCSWVLALWVDLRPWLWLNMRTRVKLH